MRVFSLFILVFLFFACSQGNRKSLVTVPEEYAGTPLEPIAKILIEKKTPSPDSMLQLAEDIEYRQDLFYLLQKYNLAESLPKKFYTMESAAESNLVNWLRHPSELDTIPTEILLLSKEKITDMDTAFTYYVFKFTAGNSHWSAEYGWMLGCVGPFLENDPPYTWPAATFSRLTNIDSVSAKDEAIWTHEHIYKNKD